MNKIIYVFIISSCLTLTAAQRVLAQAGTLDNTFGTNGIVTTNFAVAISYGNSIALQPDGKIIVAGAKTNTINGSHSDFAVARYNSNGSLDNNFGTGGKVTFDIAVNNDDAALSAAIQNDGKIVVTGYTGGTGFSNFATLRFNSDGTLDNTFGTGGKVIMNFGGAYASSGSITVLNNGKLLAAGNANVIGSTNPDFALARYNNDGSLDNTFGSGGKVTTDFTADSDDQGYSAIIQSDSKIVVAGYRYHAGADFALARYNTNGTLDNTFGTGGKVITVMGSYYDTGISAAIQSDGKIVIVSTNGTNGSNADFVLIRYNSNGTLDNTFGFLGRITTSFGGTNNFCKSLAIQSDGKFIVSGTSNNSFVLVRYNSDGSMDNTFGAGGIVNTSVGSVSEGFSLAIQTDGKIIAAGASGNNTIYDFTVIRYDGGVTGIDENKTDQNNLTVFPNPFTSQTNIAFSEEQKNTAIKIIDVLGREIKIINFTGKELLLEKGELKKGIYFLQTTDNGKHICNTKIVVQ